MKAIKYFVIILLLIISINGYNQCVSMPVLPSCSGTLVTDGINANSGTTYRYSGGTSTMTIYFNGADVIVCSGILTLSNNSTFNGGRLYILSGATVNTSQTSLNTNIYNYGTLNFTSNLTVNSQGLLMNATTGNINITGNLYENTIITNYGKVGITGELTITNSGSGICLGSDSKFNVSTIKYDWNINSININTGNACIGISSSSITGNTSLTSSSNIKICTVSALTINGGGTAGNAILNKNCASCSTPLPIELVEFKCDKQKEFIFIEWSTSSEKNNDFFSLYKSYDGLNFKDIYETPGAGTSTVNKYYSFKDYDYNTGINYYKLKQTDYDGNNSDSKVISADVKGLCALITF